MFPNNFSCSDTYNVSGHTYAVEQEDGGIPENLGINFCIWLVIFLTFCMIRRWAWDYGRIALVQSEAKGWTKIFFGTTDASDDQSINESEKTLHMQTEDVSDKGFFSWIAVVFKLSDDDLKHRAGHDAIHYLNFQKCLIYYTVIICVLSIVVILPVNHSGNNIPRRNHYGTTTIANLAPDSNVIWLHTIFAFLYLAILIVMLWKFSQGYETDHDPVSQLTILVSHVSQSASTDQLKQHFEEVYGEGSVSNVQLAYDICQLVVISRKLEAASLGKKTYVMNAMRGGGNQETVVSTNKVCPCCPCWKVKYNGLEYFVKEEEKYKNEFLREKEAVLGSESLGIVFVTFDKPNIVLRCIQDYSLILGGRYIESSMSLALKSSVWSVERAPSPGNIIWENLSADPKYWWIRTAFINVVLFVFVLFVSTPAILLTGWNQLQASIENKADSRGNPFLNQFLPTLMLWTFTAILPAIVSWSSYYEYQWTRTRQEKSVMFKVYIFLLFMIVILPSLALTSLDAFFEMTFKGDFQSFQSRLKCVFLPDSGAFFVNYVITSALIGTALELLRFPELFVYGIRMCYAKTEGEKLLVKQEAVVEFPFGIQYAWMIAIYSIIIIYSIACPLVVPFGLLYLLLKHFVDRYNLFFNYRPPAFKYMDRSVHNTAMYFLIVSTFLLLFCILFYSIIRLGIRDPQTIFALVVFLITLTLFIGKVCFGWFASYSIYRYPEHILVRLPPNDLSQHDEVKGWTAETSVAPSSPSRDGQEEVIPDGQIPEAYLPPVLRSSYRVGDLSDDEQANILRRRHYGIQDHVIDSANLRQSDDVIVDVPFEELNTAESK